MNSIESKIDFIIYNQLRSYGINSTELQDKLKKEIIKEIDQELDKNLINLLEICKIVKNEKNGLLFIEELIINLISKK